MCVSIIDLKEESATVKIFSEVVTDDRNRLVLRLHDIYCQIAKMQRRQKSDIVKKELGVRLMTIESAINALEIKDK